MVTNGVIQKGSGIVSKNIVFSFKPDFSKKNPEAEKESILGVHKMYANLSCDHQFWTWTFGSNIYPQKENKKKKKIRTQCLPLEKIKKNSRVFTNLPLNSRTTGDLWMPSIEDGLQSIGNLHHSSDNRELD